MATIHHNKIQSSKEVIDAFYNKGELFDYASLLPVKGPVDIDDSVDQFVRWGWAGAYAIPNGRVDDTILYFESKFGTGDKAISAFMEQFPNVPFYYESAREGMFDSYYSMERDEEGEVKITPSIITSDPQATFYQRTRWCELCISSRKWCSNGIAPLFSGYYETLEMIDHDIRQLGGYVTWGIGGNRENPLVDYIFKLWGKWYGISGMGDKDVELEEVFAKYKDKGMQGYSKPNAHDKEIAKAVLHCAYEDGIVNLSKDRLPTDNVNQLLVISLDDNVWVLTYIGDNDARSYFYAVKAYLERHFSDYDKINLVHFF